MAAIGSRVNTISNANTVLGIRLMMILLGRIPAAPCAV